MGYEEGGRHDRWLENDRSWNFHSFNERWIRLVMVKVGVGVERVSEKEVVGSENG